MQAPATPPRRASDLYLAVPQAPRWGSFAEEPEPTRARGYIPNEGISPYSSANISGAEGSVPSSLMDGRFGPGNTAREPWRVNATRALSSPTISQIHSAQSNNHMAHALPPYSHLLANAVLQNSAGRRRNRAHTDNLSGFSLDDDEMSARAVDSSFEIYTESQARVPKMDISNGNPFYRPAAKAAAKAADSSKKGKVPKRPAKSQDRINEENEMDAAVARGEGLIFMFRGRKQFHRFSDVNQTSNAGNTAAQRSLKRAVGVAGERYLTRSQLTPRLLFPSVSASHNSNDDDDDDNDEDDDTATAAVDTDMEHGPHGSDETTVSMSTNDGPDSGAVQTVPPVKTRASLKFKTRASHKLKTRVSHKLKTRVSHKFKTRVSPKKKPDTATHKAMFPPTPPTSSRKSKPNSGLDSSVEDVSDSAVVAPTRGEQRKGGSLFDSWPRTKATMCTKREGGTLQAASMKRSRRSTADSLSET